VEERIQDDMICLVDMEQRQAKRFGPSSAESGPQSQVVPELYLEDIQQRLKRISGAQCVIRRYTDVSQQWLDAEGIEALILGGNRTEWDAYDKAELLPLMEIVRSAHVPMLGLCGGLQLIALANGVRVGPIRKLESGQEDIGAVLDSGYFKEWGFTPIQVIGCDPLFEGLNSPVFLEAHYWEVKDVPDGFELLASTDACRIQAFRRVDRPVYGTQFHPEAYIAEPSDRHNWLIELVYPTGYTREQPDGRHVLTNFLRVAGVVP
jgi:GMP synthase (glutamine-hydrolysing)